MPAQNNPQSRTHGFTFLQTPIKSGQSKKARFDSHRARRANLLVKYKTSGFTLVEIVVAITIIATLSTIALTSFNGIQAAARNAKRKADLEDIKKALFFYRNASATFNPHGKGCTSWGAAVSNAAWGFEGTNPCNTCSCPLKNTLSPYLKGGVAYDPKYKDDPNKDYFLYVLDDDRFFISATLEGVSPTLLPSCAAYTGGGSRNYCISQD